MSSTDTSELEAKIEQILEDFQGSTIIIDTQGSVLGPEEDARAFMQSRQDTKIKLTALLAAQKQRFEAAVVIAELEQARNYLNLEPYGLSYEQEKVLIDRINKIEAELAALDGVIGEEKSDV